MGKASWALGVHAFYSSGGCRGILEEVGKRKKRRAEEQEGRKEGGEVGRRVESRGGDAREEAEGKWGSEE